MTQIPYPGAIGRTEPQDHVPIFRMTFGTGQKADVGDPIAVRRDMREPVDTIVNCQLIDAATVCVHPEELRMSGTSASTLRVEVDPLPIRRVLRAVIREVIIRKL